MTDFEKAAEEGLPCRNDGCWKRHATGCPAFYRPAILALLKSADAQARRKTWEKCIRVLKDSPQGIWCAQEDLLRAEMEKDTKG